MAELYRNDTWRMFGSTRLLAAPLLRHRYGYGESAAGITLSIVGKICASYDLNLCYDVVKHIVPHRAPLVVGGGSSSIR